MKYALALVVLVLTLSAASRAADLPDAASIKGNDLVIATREGEVKNVTGYVARNTYLGVTLQKSKTDDKNPLNIPAAAILYVFYEEANNEAFMDGLKAYGAKKYDDALENFNEAGAALTGLTVPARKEEFLQNVNYYSGLCKYHQGDFKGAIDAFDLCLRPREAIFKFQAEYYSARSMEGMGDYEKAESKYGQLIGSVYPKLLEKATWGQKWLQLSKLGQQRANLLLNAQRDGQENNVSKAKDAFEAILKESGDKIDEETMNDALMVRVAAEKYLARKTPAKYADVNKLLDKPVRDAVIRNDRAALAWMYCDVADSYFGLMEAETDAAKKKDLAEKARFEYMRIWMTTNASLANLCKAYFRTAKLCEFLKDKDWQARATQAYRYAANGRFKGQMLSEEANTALKALEAAAGGDKPGEKPAGK